MKTAFLMSLLVGFCFIVTAQDNLFRDPNFTERTPGKNTLVHWLTVGGTISTEHQNFALKPVKGPDEKIKTSIRQDISALKPGRYLLSGKVKGDFNALWLLLRYSGTSAITPPYSGIWVDKKNLSAPDEKGWLQFSNVVTVPEGVTSGLFYLEAYFRALDTVIEFDFIGLAPQND